MSNIQTCLSVDTPQIKTGTVVFKISLIPNEIQERNKLGISLGIHSNSPALTRRLLHL